MLCIEYFMINWFDSMFPIPHWYHRVSVSTWYTRYVSSLVKRIGCLQSSWFYQWGIGELSSSQMTLYTRCLHDCRQPIRLTNELTYLEYLIYSMNIKYRWNTCYIVCLMVFKATFNNMVRLFSLNGISK
jgi:hypothetical protein